MRQRDRVRVAAGARPGRGARGEEHFGAARGSAGRNGTLGEDGRDLSTPPRLVALFEEARRVQYWHRRVSRGAHRADGRQACGLGFPGREGSRRGGLRGDAALLRQRGLLRIPAITQRSSGRSSDHPGFVAGPVAQSNQTIHQMCGARLPEPFLGRLGVGRRRFGGDGVRHRILLTAVGGPPPTRRSRRAFYTLNKPGSTVRVVQNLGLAWSGAGRTQGRTMEIVVPRPGGTRSDFPSCASAARATMARPSPVPFGGGTQQRVKARAAVPPHSPPVSRKRMRRCCGGADVRIGRRRVRMPNAHRPASPRARSEVRLGRPAPALWDPR